MRLSTGEVVLTLCTTLVSALLGGLGSCAPAAAPSAPRAAANSVTSPPPSAPTAPSRARAKRPQRIPLRETDTGIAGAPRDDTAFEYDVEVAEDSAAPTMTGVPALSQSVVRALQPYLETRRAKLSALSPDKDGALVITRLAETSQVHLVATPLAMRRQLTFGPEPVEQASFALDDVRRIVYRGDVGGTEDHQIFSLDRRCGAQQWRGRVVLRRPRRGAYVPQAQEPRRVLPRHGGVLRALPGPR